MTVTRLAAINICSLAVLAGGLVAFTACAAALDHNPQEEFYSAATGITANLYILGVLAFLETAAAVALVLGLPAAFLITLSGTGKERLGGGR